MGPIVKPLDSRHVRSIYTWKFPNIWDMAYIMNASTLFETEESTKSNRMNLLLSDYRRQETGEDVVIVVQVKGGWCCNIALTLHSAAVYLCRSTTIQKRHFLQSTIHQHHTTLQHHLPEFFAPWRIHYHWALDCTCTFLFKKRPLSTMSIYN